MSKTYTVKEVAEILGYSTNSIYTFLKEGRIVGVRVGKGRFRIPQEELDQLLHLKKTPSNELESVPSQQTVFSPLSQPIQSTTQNNISSEISNLNTHLDKTRQEKASLFDWFISIASIVFGFTEILLNHHLGTSLINIFPLILISIKIDIFFAGTGLLIINLLGKNSKWWYLIFYFILGLSYAGFALVSFLNFDIQGGVVFIMLVISIIFHLILKSKGTISFVLFLSFFIIFFPVIVFIFPGIIDLRIIPIFSFFSHYSFGLFWFMFAVFAVSFYWLVAYKKKFFKIIFIVVLSSILFGIAYLYAEKLYWCRSIFLILLIIFSVIGYFWEYFNLADKNKRIFVFKMFSGCILTICVAVVASIWFNQKNLVEFNSENLKNKLAYGHNLVEMTISSSIEQIKNMSISPYLLQVLINKDKENIRNLSKDLFINSKNFRRILITAENGDIIETYPETILPYKNLSFREYFTYVKETKNIYISNLFETSNNNQKIFTITISAPILDSEKKVMGVLIGSIDLNKLSEKLQKIASDDKGEYFEIVDVETNKIISPGYFYTEEPIKVTTDLINKGRIGKYGVDEVFENGNSMIVVSDNIDIKNWKMMLKQPYLSSLKFNKEIILFTLFSALGANLLVVLINLMCLKRKEI